MIKNWCLIEFVKRISVVFSVILGISLSASAQEEDCNKFHRGCFIFEASENEIYLIKRTRKYQEEIEIHSATKATIQLRWLNNCTYELIYPRKEPTDTIPLQDIPILINIFDIKDNTFSFTSSGFDDMIILEGKMRKVKRKEYRRKKQGINF